MNKVKIIHTITKLYFLAALAGSFSHILTAAEKIGLSGWEMWSTPFMIDGLAVIGLTMRSECFARHTRKTGLRTQMAAGLLSLIANVYAAHNLGGVVYGIGIVALFLAAEALSARIEGAEADKARDAKSKRSAAASKAAATRKRNAAKRKREVKVLENMIKS